VSVEAVELRLAKLGRALRESGVGVSLGDEIDAARAWGLLDATDREELRRGLRIALKVPRRAWEVFDHLFEGFWTGRAIAAKGRARAPRAHGFESRGGRFPRWNAERGAIEGDAAPAAESGQPGFSPAALLRRKPLPECSAEELAALDRVLVQWARRLATQPSRRLVPSTGRGLPDPRRSFRKALATAGEFVRLAHRRRAVEVPRIVFLCDTSGSMAPYTRFLLAFALSLKRVAPRTEVFAFNTALTRLSALVAPARLGQTLERMAAAVPDWGGGTRIGACLAAFAAGHLACVDRRSVVVILSDGLDRGDVEELRAAMQAIRARARRVVWLNPLLRDPRYRPEARGMQAALPFVDDFAPAHDADSLARLLPRLVA
jgi:uncharacterized protein with von Willebrand factor type A (vWA) domain